MAGLQTSRLKMIRDNRENGLTEKKKGSMTSAGLSGTVIFIDELNDYQAQRNILSICILNTVEK